MSLSLEARWILRKRDSVDRKRDRDIHDKSSEEKGYPKRESTTMRSIFKIEEGRDARIADEM